MSNPLPNLTLQDFQASEDMLKASLAATLSEGKDLEIEWARINLNAQFDDIQIEQL